MNSSWSTVLFLVAVSFIAITAAQNCRPIYVRWSRVKLAFRPKVEGPYAMEDCRKACTKGEHPARTGYPLECAGFNQRQGPSKYQHDCQIYQADQLQNVDGNAEADDRYSFYWKYCITASKNCVSDYQFTFHSDRYMDKGEVARLIFTSSLEDCLSMCLDEPMFTCRSVSFNRTDGGCHMSPQNMLSKPQLIRLNNNPNFRIDYYESNCYNNSFTFKHECRDDGINVEVQSQFPYTGVLYGLYDYFTCRYEPKEQEKFSLFFPSPAVSKNCSDSVRFSGSNMILEVVLSTDGVEPLYFITAEDLTYQAKCPISKQHRIGASIDLVPLTSKRPSKYVGAIRATTRNTKIPPPSSASWSSSGGKDTYQLPWIDPGNSSLEDKEGDIRRNGTRISVLVGRSRTLPASTETTTSSSSTTTSTSTTSTTTTTTTTTSPASTSTSTKTTPTTSTTGKRLVGNPKKDGVEVYKSTQIVTSQPVKAKTTTTVTTTKEIKTTPEHSQLLQGSPKSSFRQTTRTSAPRWTPPTPVTKELPSLPPKLFETKPTTTSTTTTTTKPTTSTTTTTTTQPTTTTTTTTTARPTTTTTPPQPILFDIFNGGQPVEAVVVGSKVTLSFTPFYAIPSSYMTISGCQIEPVGSLYEWEKEPLPIIKDGCQSDNVGLVCPPERTDFGMRVRVEAFRYQTTAEVQYTCLIRVCPFSPCPQTYCPTVEGCKAPTADQILRQNAARPPQQYGQQNNYRNPQRQSRQKRQLTLEQLQQALLQNPDLQRQLALLPLPPQAGAGATPGGVGATVATGVGSVPGVPRGVARPPAQWQQYLVSLGGDHIVKKRLVVVNSGKELQYYFRTGAAPRSGLSQWGKKR